MGGSTVSHRSGSERLSREGGVRGGAVIPRAECTCMGSVLARKGEIDTDAEPHTLIVAPQTQKNHTCIISGSDGRGRLILCGGVLNVTVARGGDGR